MARQPRGGTELGWSSFKAAFPGKVSYLTCLSGKTLPAWLPVLDLVQSSPSLKPFPRERQQATGATSKMRPWGGGSPVLLLFTLLRAGRGFRTPGDAGRRPELLEQKAIRCGGGGPPPRRPQAFLSPTVGVAAYRPFITAVPAATGLSSRFHF